jgi:hypothetical protein
MTCIRLAYILLWDYDSRPWDAYWRMIGREMGLGGEMSRNVAVLATVHDVQGAERRPGGSFEDPEYPRVIEGLVAHHSVDSIVEDACACGPTTAEKLANDRGLRYLDVEARAFGTEIHTEEGPLFAQEKLDAQVGREEFWVNRIAKQPSGSGLMICGYLHTFRLAVRLDQAEFEVTVHKHLPFCKFCAT